MATATKKRKSAAAIHRIGRRKTATARVFLSDGSGNITVNGRVLEEYFPREALCRIIRQPLDALNASKTVDIVVTAKGGGMNGQAGAIRLGIARALVAQEEGDVCKTAEELAACEPNDPDTVRAQLKKRGLLRRDSRKVERKKCGQPKARKKKQFSKR